MEIAPKALGNTVFPLYAYTGPTDGSYTLDGVAYSVGQDFRTQERYAEYAAAGFNILLLQGNDPYTGEAWEESRTKRNMDNALAAGLRVIVFDRRLHDLCLNKTLVGPGSRFSDRDALAAYVRGCVKDYSAHPAFYGIQLKDEPRYEYLETVGLLYRAIKAALPEAFVQINLFPMNASANRDRYFGASKENTLESNYRQYLEHFLDCTGADYLLYDNYPFLNEDGLLYVRPDHLPGLVLSSTVARERGVQLHNVAQSCAMDVGGLSKIRVPSQADMLWQVSLLLAFGVKQLAWFTYWTKQANSTAGETFPDGASFVSRDGTVNPLYHWVRDIHEAIQGFAAQILPLELSGCRTYVQGTVADYGAVSSGSLPAVEDCAVAAGQGALVTQLSGTDTQAICVQNICDPELHTGDVLKLSLTARGRSEKTVSMGSGQVRVSGNRLTAELKPGEAVFWFLKKS